ncbi:hypothetical protein D3C72_536330 [compost metagenome]
MEKNKIAQLPEFLFRNEADVLYGDPVTGTPQNVSFEREIADLADEMITSTTALFDDAGVLLDYSEESLEDLERLATQLWPNPIEEQEALDALLSNWGAYLGQAILENLGGEWTFRKDLEHASVHFPRTGLEAFPFHKMRKRLALGAEDSMVDFYEAIVEELTQDQI